MKIDIRPSFEFALPLTLEQVGVLMTLSRHHYDARCKSASNQGGFLARWRYRIDDLASVEDRPITYASWEELDTCCKLLEMRRLAAQTLLLKPSEHVISNDLATSFHGAITLANSKVSEWRATYESKESHVR